VTSQDTPASPPASPPTPAPPTAPAPQTPTSPVLTPRLGVKALIVHDAHVLMNHVVSVSGQDHYTPPGGGQEHGEDQVTALIRECYEEIGARVEVHQVASVFEVMTDRSFRDGAAVPLFHQVNIAYWCGLAPGEAPGVGSDPDSGQVGSAWLPLDRLDRYDVRPVELARWLLADPSDRPLALGVTGILRTS